MQTTDLNRRIAEFKREHTRGYYVDALELERDLLLDLIGESHVLAWERLEGNALIFVNQCRSTHRELTGP